jgi:hypothetical protein
MAVLICRGCGTHFDSAVASTRGGDVRGNSRKFCSLPCRWKAYRAVYTTRRTCRRCRKRFDSLRRRQFCSIECRGEAMRERQQSRVRTATMACCAACGKTFAPRDKRCKKFCSRQCSVSKRKHALGTGLADGWLRVLLLWVRVITREQRREARQQLAGQQWREWQCRQCGGIFQTRDRLRCVCLTCVADNEKAARKMSKAVRRSKCKSLVRENASPDAIFARDGWQCQQCKCRVSKRLDVNHDRYPNLDHVIPLSRGGTHTCDNLQCLCRACNLQKSDKQLNLF